MVYLTSSGIFLIPKVGIRRADVRVRYRSGARRAGGAGEDGERKESKRKKLPNDRVAREPFENPFSPELPPQRFAWGRERFSRSRMKRSFY